ncbi:MAG TPA: 3-oxoacyl-[acyl-carrier-protein] reductase [Chitinophagales bacterium]|nr:3-oxoacyl-[acyl-carrier-protein] reductase [Chitinophagales bacterium]
MRLLENKIALITGASRGIGEAIAKKFAENGAAVAFTYRQSDEKAKSLEDSLVKNGVKAKAYKSDASKFTDADALVKAVLQDFGKIDVLVNNAGITRDSLLLRMTEQQWDEVLSNNLKSVFNLTRFTAYHMLKQKNGSIINVSSIVGLTGNAGQANYTASKAGIVGFTKSIAQELGSRSIRCNAIAPGFIETDMTKALDEKTAENLKKNIPLNRLGQAAEVANVALFLASDLSSYVTGQVLSVCGGMYR